MKAVLERPKAETTDNAEAQDQLHLPSNRSGGTLASN
jgi:hypothetical protein